MTTVEDSAKVTFWRNTLDWFWGRLLEQDEQKVSRSRNWALILGWSMVLLSATLAVAGPHLAPRDPSEMAPLLKVGDKYHVPPFPVFAPGYPLGSDGFGRDLFSRLLWAVRPTMTMVLVVAAVRLVLGTMIGMAAGWSSRWPGKLLDNAIAAALSIPVIIVALAGIAVVGVELGIWAFIVGLCLTGWGETARIVREQTRAVRGQVYVEAARALGASNNQILVRHVLKQILPLIWMLFAFEISATLMLTAALGFLGYYIGGDVWVAVTDAAAVAATGLPELGQLLATTETSVTRPWPLIAIGAVVFLIVLGLTLLGEGLRQQLNMYELRPRSLIGQLVGRVGFWLEDKLWWPVVQQPWPRAAHYFLVMLALLSLGGGLLWWRDFAPRIDRDFEQVPTLSQAQPWTGKRGDPSGNRWVRGGGPASPEVAWSFRDESGFTGGPAISVDGTVFILSAGGQLYALKSSGELLWQVELEATPVGSPALDERGVVYVTDTRGVLSAFAPEGDLAWRFEPQDGIPASTGPVAAPGKLFYTRRGSVQAVSADGRGLWLSRLPSEISHAADIRVAPHESLLFVENAVLDATNGVLLDYSSLGNVDRFFVGGKSELYRVEGHEATQWRMDELGVETVQTLTWDHSKFTIARTPKDVGSAPDGSVWLLYTSFARTFGLGEDTRIIWLDKDGRNFGNVHYPTRNSQVIAVDQEATVYSCGNIDFGYGAPECQAFSPDAEEPVWKLLLEGTEVAGGALVPGRLYVATTDGLLYAIGMAKGIPPDEVIAHATPEQVGKPTTTQDDHIDVAGEPEGPRTGGFSLILEVPGGFTGGPAVRQDGLAYIASMAGHLYALSPDGEIAWQTSLPSPGVGAPAIGADGTIYLADKDGGLSAFSPEGELTWRFAGEEGMTGIAGPSVSPDGVIFYTVGTTSRGSIQAVSYDGVPLWREEVRTGLFYTSPQASPAGDFIFFRNEVFNSRDGTRLDLGLPFEVNEVFAGQDGENYLRAEGTVVAWEYDGNAVSLAEERVISREGRPDKAGVTPQRVVWLLYNPVILWFDRDGQGLGASFLSNTLLTHVLGVDADLTVYACGRNFRILSQAKPVCMAIQPGENKPLWVVQLGNTLEAFHGGALVQGRLYVATEGGQLYMFRDE